MTENIPDSQSWLNRYDETFMHNFGKPKCVFASGKGAELWDVDGKRYIDMFSGIAVGALGHAHPDVTRAITKQLETLGHISNIFASQPQIELAEKLAALATVNTDARASEASARVYFANSGTEANEAAFKITRLTGRKKIVAMEGSFHGRTMGALAITATEKYRKPFEPLPGDVEFVPYGDSDALATAVDDQTAAVVLEPIQGESGVVVPPEGFLSVAREISSTNGALLWVDEVQTGIGRCGEWFVSIAEGITPDLITVAKGLGNGFPVGACIAIGEAGQLFTPGSHGSTFSGNPVAAAAGLAVLDTIERDRLLGRVAEAGRLLSERLLALDDPRITEVRGRGLLLGVQFSAEIASALADGLLSAGWIVNAPRPTVLRLAPPLIVSDAQLVDFVAALAEQLEVVGK